MTVDLYANAKTPRQTTMAAAAPEELYPAMAFLGQEKPNLFDFSPERQYKRPPAWSTYDAVKTEHGEELFHGRVINTEWKAPQPRSATGKVFDMLLGNQGPIEKRTPHAERTFTVDGTTKTETVHALAGMLFGERAVAQCRHGTLPKFTAASKFYSSDVQITVQERSARYRSQDQEFYLPERWMDAVHADVGSNDGEVLAEAFVLYNPTDEPCSGLMTPVFVNEINDRYYMFHRHPIQKETYEGKLRWMRMFVQVKPKVATSKSKSVYDAELTDQGPKNLNVLFNDKANFLMANPHNVTVPPGGVVVTSCVEPFRSLVNVGRAWTYKNNDPSLGVVIYTPGKGTSLGTGKPFQFPKGRRDRAHYVRIEETLREMASAVAKPLYEIKDLQNIKIKWRTNRGHGHDPVVPPGWRTREIAYVNAGDDGSLTVSRNKPREPIVAVMYHDAGVDFMATANNWGRGGRVEYLRASFVDMCGKSPSIY